MGSANMFQQGWTFEIKSSDEPKTTLFRDELEDKILKVYYFDSSMLPSDVTLAPLSFYAFIDGEEEKGLFYFSHSQEKVEKIHLNQTELASLAKAGRIVKFKKPLKHSGMKSLYRDSLGHILEGRAFAPESDPALNTIAGRQAYK